MEHRLVQRKAWDSVEDGRGQGEFLVLQLKFSGDRLCGGSEGRVQGSPWDVPLGAGERGKQVSAGWQGDLKAVPAEVQQKTASPRLELVAFPQGAHSWSWRIVSDVCWSESLEQVPGHVCPGPHCDGGWCLFLREKEPACISFASIRRMPLWNFNCSLRSEQQLPEMSLSPEWPQEQLILSISLPVVREAL